MVSSKFKYFDFRKINQIPDKRNVSSSSASKKLDFKGL